MNKQQAGARQKLICSILESKDVQFQWCIFNVELDDSLASSLLQRTVYDSPWVWPCICMLETKKTLEKKKSLRTILYSN